MNINNNQPGNIVGSQSLPQGGVQMQKDQNTNIQNHMEGPNLSSNQGVKKQRTVWQAISSFFKGIGNFLKNIFSPKAQEHSVTPQTFSESPTNNTHVNINDETKQDKTPKQPKSETNTKIEQPKQEAQQGDPKNTSRTDNSENTGENLPSPSSSSNPTPDPTLVKPTDGASQAEIAKPKAKADQTSQPASQEMPQVEPKAPEATAAVNKGDVPPPPAPPPPPPPPPPPAPAPNASQNKEDQNLNKVETQLNHLDLIKAGNFKLKPSKSEADQLKDKLGWSEDRWERIKIDPQYLKKEEINQLIEAAGIQDPLQAQLYSRRFDTNPKDALKSLEGKIPGLAEILGHKKMEHSESEPNLSDANKPLESPQSLKKSASESEIKNVGDIPPPPPPPPPLTPAPQGIPVLDTNAIQAAKGNLRKIDSIQKNEKPVPESSNNILDALAKVADQRNADDESDDDSDAGDDGNDVWA